MTFIKDVCNFFATPEITNFISALSAIATAIMACLTRQMLKEAKLTREEELRPYIVMYLENFEHECWLICENIGRTSAHNVTFDFKKALVNSHGYNISSTVFPSSSSDSSISLMAPGYKIKTFVDSTIEASNFQNITVDITYYSASQKKYPETSTLNFSIIKNIHFVKSNQTKATDSLSEINDSLEKISNSLESIKNLSEDTKEEQQEKISNPPIP